MVSDNQPNSISFPSETAWKRVAIAFSLENENDLPGATTALFPKVWQPQVFWSPEHSLPPISHPLPLRPEQLEWLGDHELPPGYVLLTPGKVCWRIPSNEYLVQILFQTQKGEEHLVLEWLDNQGLLAGLKQGPKWANAVIIWGKSKSKQEQQSRFLLSKQGNYSTSWTMLIRSWEAWMAQLLFQIAQSQQQAEGRRCRLVLRLADAISDQPDPDRFLDRLWTAVGEYGIISIQWWSPRFEARRVVDFQGPRWERPARPNAMEIDCAQAGSALQYSDRQASIMLGRTRWRLCIPVKDGQKIAGGGVISFTADRRFTLEESDAFEQCASFMERALKGVDERIQIAQQSAQREFELKQSLDALVYEIERTKKNEAIQTTLFHIARLASDNAHASDFHQRVHAILDSLIRSDTLGVLLCDESTPDPLINNMKIVYLGKKDYQKNNYCVDDTKQHNKLAIALAHQTYQRRAPVLARDPRRGAAAGSWMAAPLIDEGCVIGALCLRASEGFTHGPEDLDLLSLCSQQVAHAISRQRAVALLEARVNERTNELKIQQAQAERQALHDPLTDLPNRRHLENHLECSLMETEQGKPMVLMFLDLDHFKAVNDNFGHAAGDTVLVEVSKRLNSCLRPSDFVARMSGDEFIVLLQPAGNHKNCQLVAERLIEKINEPILLENGLTAQVGCSIGWTRVEGLANIPAAELLARADKAMYSAKRSGRGKAISFDWNVETKTKSKRTRTRKSKEKPIDNN